MEIDIEEIQQSFSENDYMAICAGDDSIAQECLENARIYVQAVADSYDIEYDEADPVLRLAVKKKTLAELYSYAAEWTTAEQYITEVSRILNPLAPVTASDGTAVRKASGCTVTGNGDWKGYS
ncbi:MAG: hypothetical protein AB7E96_01685 [Deferribacterales bacterium]